MKYSLHYEIFALIVFLLAAGLAFADSVGPDITLKTPANNSTVVLNISNFTFTPVDDGRIINCYLYINSTLYTALTSVTNNTENKFENITLGTDGIYYWYAQCTDNATNTRASGESYFIFDLDDTKPTIQLSPGNSSLNYSSGAATFTYTATDWESGLQQCELIVDNDVKATTSSPSNGTQASFTLTLPAPASYTWSVNCTDRNYNEANSGAALLQSGDPDAPSLSVEYPTNNTVTGSTLVTIRFTPTTVETLSHCALFVNGTINRTLQDPNENQLNNFTNIELHDGAWRWSINCSAISGKSAATGEMYLNVSYQELLSTYLVITANSPAENHYDKTGSPSFTYTPASVSNIESCSLITNNSVREVSRSVKSHTINSFNSVEMADGVWNWRIECVNNQGLIVSTPLRTLTVARAIAIGVPVPADVEIPGLETPLDLGEINTTLIEQKREASRLFLLIMLTAGSAASAVFVFVMMHPKYKKIALRQFGMGKVMQVEQLKFYIDRSLRRGISEERVRRHLKKYNWDEKDIDDAFQSVYAEMAEELKVREEREEATSQ